MKQDEFAALKKAWEQRCKVDPFEGTYDRIKTETFANESINAGDIADALDFVAAATGDDLFKRSALALRAYGLAGGGLKQDTTRMLIDHHRTAAWGAMPKIHEWVVRQGLSIREAAARVAARLGIKGQSFNAVVDDLRKTYPSWIKAIENKGPGRIVNDGDTGRKLRVRFARPWLDADNRPIAELMGIKFDDEGFGLAPDNREWRRFIQEGQIALYGVSK